MYDEYTDDWDSVDWIEHWEEFFSPLETICSSPSENWNTNPLTKNPGKRKEI